MSTRRPSLDGDSAYRNRIYAERRTMLSLSPSFDKLEDRTAASSDSVWLVEQSIHWRLIVIASPFLHGPLSCLSPGGRVSSGPFDSHGVSHGLPATHRRTVSMGAAGNDAEPAPRLEHPSSLPKTDEKVSAPRQMASPSLVGSDRQSRLSTHEHGEPSEGLSVAFRTIYSLWDAEHRRRGVLCHDGLVASARW